MCSTLGDIYSFTALGLSPTIKDLRPPSKTPVHVQQGHLSASRLRSHGRSGQLSGGEVLSLMNTMIQRQTRTTTQGDSFAPLHFQPRGLKTNSLPQAPGGSPPCCVRPTLYISHTPTLLTSVTLLWYRKYPNLASYSLRELDTSASAPPCTSLTPQHSFLGRRC